MRARHTLVLAIVTLCLPIILGCDLAGAIGKVWNQDDSDEQTREDQRLLDREEQITGNRQPQSHPAPEGTDEVLTFAFQGENPAHHTGLLGRTVFYVDYEAGTVKASESEPFEEPAGSQTRRGTDSIEFNGTYDSAAKTFSGTLTIRTEGTATGSESPANTVTYTMTGQFEASFSDDTWTGKVIGSSRLTQAWADERGLDVDDNLSVDWTATSATREVGTW